MPSVRPKGQACVLSFRDYAVNIHYLAAKDVDMESSKSSI